MVCLSSSVFAPAFAQNNPTKKEADAAYYKVVQQRAGKIVASLGLADSGKAERVQTIIARQYQNLNNIHTNRDAKIKTAKGQADQSKLAAWSPNSPVEETRQYRTIQIE